MKINQALDLDDSGTQERGVRARERLLQEAIGIFASKGFAKASTREICQAAGANVAAIHYYFGDKAGLYRAALLRPIEALTSESEFANFDDPDLPLDEALRRLMSAFLCPARPQGAAGEQAEQGMRLYLREMVEPSAAYKEVIAQHIQPHHQRVVKLLARHVGVTDLDDALHHLAFVLLAMVHDYSLSREFMTVLAPALLHGDGAARQVLNRLVGYGVALVVHERNVRAVAH